MLLSPNFTLAELTRSDYALRMGLDNTPPAVLIESLRELAIEVLEPVRTLLGGRPIHTNSGYRSPAVNQGIGGSPTSQHMKGEAADIEVPHISHKDAIRFIIASEIPYDQIIWEGGDRGWIHISHAIGRPQRKQALTAVFPNGKAVYSPFV